MTERSDPIAVELECGHTRLVGHFRPIEGALIGCIECVDLDDPDEAPPMMILKIIPFGEVGAVLDGIAGALDELEDDDD